MAWKDKNIQIGSLLGPGAVVDGHFKTTGSARIDGEVKGNVEVEGALIIGETGKVDGDVTALSVTVGGEVLGDVDAQDRVELMEGAKVLGDITTKVLVIDENAIFQGKCNMYQDVPNKKGKAKKPLGGNKKSAKAAVLATIQELKEKEQADEAAASNVAVSSETSVAASTDNGNANNNVMNSEQNNVSVQNGVGGLDQSSALNVNGAPETTSAQNQIQEQNKAEEQNQSSSQGSLASKLLGLLREDKSDSNTSSETATNTPVPASDSGISTEQNAESQTTNEQEKTEQNSTSDGNSIPGINTSLLS